MLAHRVRLFLAVEDGILGNVRILRIIHQVLDNRLCLFSICIVSFIQVAVKLYVATIFKDWSIDLGHLEF